MVSGVDWQRLTCEEASVLSRATYVPCAQPACAIVWHNKDRRAYTMCEACADHNVRNRGGILLAERKEGGVKNYHVICCNDSVEYVVVGSEDHATAVRDKLWAEHLKKTGLSVRDFNHVCYWHIHTVKGEG